MTVKIARQMREGQLHRSVADFLRLALRPPTLWTTIGHGGGGRVRGAQLKAMGVQPGWPDLIVIAPGPIIVPIELKAKGGRQSPEQRLVAHSFYNCRIDYFLCRSVADVELALKCVNVKLYATVGVRGRVTSARDMLDEGAI